MIRLAISSDLGVLPDIERSAAGRFLGTPMAWASAGDPLPPAVLAQAMADGLLWVALDETGRPAGFALARPLDADLFLAEMSVALPHQGRGLGRALLQAVIDHAAAACTFHGVVLTTDRELPWNGPFYRRAGFVEVPVEQQGPSLRAQLRHEADAGFDPARRCAMRLSVSAH
ncbi:GNAT family N-acetyltransferase [Streptomyces cavourensis]|jgi:GNAT superfamily N-acetyltransferase|nr:GNAT family N-acetyltransferase [Streptomyces cavourensis]